MTWGAGGGGGWLFAKCATAAITTTSQEMLRLVSPTFLLWLILEGADWMAVAHLQRQRENWEQSLFLPPAPSPEGLVPVFTLSRF